MNVAELAALMRRDLTTLMRQVEAFPSDEMLWKVVPGITNSAGNLVLHLEGNLREYIGRQLGELSYTRDRPQEFATTGIGKRELTDRIADLIDVIPSVLQSLSPERLQQPYPEVVLEQALTTEGFLIHLHGHLNWHLGQIEYLRRVLTGEGAIKRAAL